jgi:hypothetical protein
MSMRPRDKINPDGGFVNGRALGRPYVFGSDRYWSACSAAQLGEKRAAVDLPSQAFAEGRPLLRHDCSSGRVPAAVSGRASERDALSFLERAADLKGWR